MITKGLFFFCLALFINEVTIAHGSYADIQPLKSFSAGIIEPACDINGVSTANEEATRALTLVQRVCHLEDTLEFYKENFGFQLICHEEETDELKKLSYSRSTIKIASPQEFSIELLCTYGVHRYQRGNDLRGLVFKSSAYKGDLNLLETDPHGQRYLQTPDGHWIILVDDNELDNQTVSLDVADGLSRGALKSVSLCVSNLNSSVQYYSNVLGADVVLEPDECSALCTWRRKRSECTDGTSQYDEIAVELVQLPPTEDVDFRASKGLLVIETDKIEMDRLRVSVAIENAKKIKPVETFNDNVRLRYEDAEALSISDEDGHQYSFIPLGSFRRKQSSIRKQVITLHCFCPLRVLEYVVEKSRKCFSIKYDTLQQHITHIMQGRSCRRLGPSRLAR